MTNANDILSYLDMCQREGLSLHGLRWALTSTEASNWHPLTWASHMLDVELFGLDPGAHHLVNVALHLVNSCLLFELLRRMTGALGPSAAVALLFAVHPMHVESVAWVAERKDVLSAFFFLAALLAYASWVHRRGVPRYLLVTVLFALGLMAIKAGVLIGIGVVAKHDAKERLLMAFALSQGGEFAFVLFDVAFKANRRNVDLIRKAAAQRRR